MIKQGLESLAALIMMYQSNPSTIDKVGILCKELYNVKCKINQHKNRFVLAGLNYKKRKLEKKLNDIQNGY